MGTVKNKGFRGYLMTVAIDIGTSSTCFAYAFKTSPENIVLNTSGQEGESYKMPSSILTEPGPCGEFKAFGYDAEKEYRDMITQSKKTEGNLYTDFKMILYREKNLSIEKTMAESKIGTKRPVMDLYVMTFENLCERFLEHLKITCASDIKKQEVRWVLCVPATWNEKAKGFLRNAALKAQLIPELQSTQLIILTEATAAALYSQRRESRWSAQHMDPEADAVKEGTKHLVIDAGAGTVDITAQEALGGQHVQELTMSSGGDWGGRHIDARFGDLLVRVLGSNFTNSCKAEYPQQWYELERGFEKAKANVKDSEAKPITIQLNAVIDRHFTRLTQGGKFLTDIVNAKTSDHGVSEKDGYLVISYARVKALFKPSVDKICEEVHKILDGNKLPGLNMIFMVGGFGQCSLLVSQMKKEFPTYRISVPDEARAAVVKGAVMYGLNPGIVSRISKKTYGVAMYDTFDPKKHAAEKKETIDGEDYCADVFMPFIQKGKQLEPNTKSDMSCYPIKADQKAVAIIFHSLDRTTEDNEVVYSDSQEVHRIASESIPMPITKGGKKREVSLVFTYNDEIQVKITDVTSGNKKDITLTFDCDVRG